MTFLPLAALTKSLRKTRPVGIAHLFCSCVQYRLAFQPTTSYPIWVTVVSPQDWIGDKYRTV